MDISPESELLASADDRALVEAPTAGGDDVEPAAFVQICNFADPGLHAQVLDLALRNQAAFSASGVVTNDKDYRRSRVLFDLEACGPRMSAELHKILPWVYQRLGITPSAEGRLEMQMTAHNDGDYFRLHNDNGSPDTADRVLSYVYYCNLPPKRFSGGALRLYDSRVENGYWVGADTFHMVEPIDNSIVFFLSRLVHEVMPIQCASRSFVDSRFTLNGWVRGI
jgi:Rps23 Pro-64 3,4-dihydroxylase Tpa1-like proline 4-hydroxylase